ncbi:MAG: hypothetical protein ACFFD2_29255, partial [Promethearchaeota archaeon]
MEREKYYKYLFIIGAIWNWMVAISLFLMSIFMLELTASIFGIVVPPSLVWFHIVVGLIFLFGIGYYIVGRDISKNRGIVIIGSIEKFLFFIILLIYFFLGHLNIFAVLLVIVDFGFGCLFLEFLINNQNYGFFYVKNDLEKWVK